jgi:hypothetical protein
VARALYEEGIRSFREALTEALHASPSKDIETTIRQLVHSFLEFSEVNHQLSRYLWLCRHHEFLSGLIHHPTRVGFDPLGRLLTRTVKQGIREGKIQNLKANILWSILFGIPVGYVRDWLDGFNEEAPSLVAPQLAEACWQALRARS